MRKKFHQSMPHSLQHTSHWLLSSTYEVPTKEFSKNFSATEIVHVQSFIHSFLRTVMTQKFAVPCICLSKSQHSTILWIFKLKKKKKERVSHVIVSHLTCNIPFQKLHLDSNPCNFLRMFHICVMKLLANTRT